MIFENFMEGLNYAAGATKLFTAWGNFTEEEAGVLF
jgi:hypothetical protein